MITTGKGCEEIAEKNKKLTGKDVVAQCHVEYMKITPIEGGCNLIRVVHNNIGGKLQSMTDAKTMLKETKANNDNHIAFLRK